MKPFLPPTHSPRVAAMALAVVAILCTTSACGEDSQAALPNSSDKVTEDNPLTARQATTVRDVGRALMIELLDGVSTNGATVDDERSRESWTDCTAQQKDLFQTTYNGMFYTASVLVETARPITAAEVHTLTQEAKVAWDPSDASKGSRGIYRVSLPAFEPLRIVVHSPCYFLRSTGGDEGRTTDDALRVTGFLRQEWKR